MTAPGAVPWADDDAPHDPDVALDQERGLRDLLGDAPRRVLDLGCGGGRTLVPLAAAGHAVTGVDHDEAALARATDALAGVGAAATLVRGDFLDVSALPPGPFDAIVCLGNTLMLVADVEAAVALLRRAAARLVPDGVVVVDDLPALHWPELAEGNWQSGVSPDGGLQIVWDETDAVFALREGDAVDEDAWTIAPREQRLRLWTDGTLRLVARSAGFSDPVRRAGSHLLVLRREAAGAEPPNVASA